jgi:hypothetical protein
MLGRPTSICFFNFVMLVRLPIIHKRIELHLVRGQGEVDFFKIPA